MAANATQAISSGDLVDLVSSSGTATIYPTDDSILSVLQARFRADLPYTRIGATNLVVVNPYKTIASVNDVSAKEYEERSYKDTSLPMADSPRPLQPHIYDMAARVYLMMRRRNESQTLVSRGITGSGKSSTQKLFVNQVLRLSTHSRKEARIAEQVKALGPVLDAFGNAKTLMNPNATRHIRYTELHFNERGRISGAKVVAFGLDKSRLARLAHEERSFHVFYQLLAGATSQERDAYGLEDPSDYALLASSGCYRLPSGPFSDDSIAMDDLRGCMRTLGFKPKHINSIFDVLATILLLGNIQFADGDFHTVSAFISNMPVVEQAARRLGVDAEQLAQVLTNRTSYVRKELYTVLLSAEQSAAQRDRFIKDLYSILFAYVVETANLKLSPSKEASSAPQTLITILDHAGFQTRGPAGTSSMALYGQAPLVSAYGQNGFDEFCINFADELIHSYVIRNVFEDSVGLNAQIVGDGVSLPPVAIMDNSACVELLRGAQLNEPPVRKPAGMLGVFTKACSAFKSGKGGDHRDEDMLQELTSKFGVHASFVASSNGNQTMFGVNHYSGPCNYDVHSFVEKDADLVDSAFVSLLRQSTEPFIGRLFSGPSLAVESHSMDPNTVVQAQVSSRPIRPPTQIPLADGSLPPQDPFPLDPYKTYPITNQVNCVLSDLLHNLNSAKLWSFSCIRPNDSGSPNSFDKRRVKAQIRAMLLPDLASRKSVEFVVELDQAQFCERYVPTMQGSDVQRVTQCARSNGWKEGVDFVLGHRSVWLAYPAWKIAEDGLRTVEKEMKKGMRDDDDESMLPEENGTDYQGDYGTSYYNESNDNLLKQGNGGSYAAAPTSPYGAGGLLTPGMNSTRDFSEDQSRGAWGSDKEAPPPETPKETDGFAVKESPTAVEEIPSSRSRRFWVGMTWALTWWIPTFTLKHLGRMKRPDVRMAWREKVAICILIFLLNGSVVFFIVAFPRLLCPDYDKAWNSQEVAQHTGDNDWYASVQGRVYDLTNFVHGDHSSQQTNIASNGADTLDQLAGQDLTYYFPPPLPLACPDLVTDSSLSITYKNFTQLAPGAIHKSGRLALYPNSDLGDQDWYKNTLTPKLNEYYKGPVVWDWDNIRAQVSDETIQKIWAVYENKLIDLTDYFWTITSNPASVDSYQFLDTNITDVFKQQAGQDVTQALNAVKGKMDTLTWQRNYNCLLNNFSVGETDFRKSARCTVQPILLVVLSSIIMSTIGIKFLAALQLGSKSHPEMQDKFVLCQVPCYTEGEDSLRRTIDSLAALEYDDKRKLIFIICDGNIIGSGNDKTTPRLVLDILGVDPKLDPEPLLFKSVGEGSKALNYGKIYSGLYEFEGHVVPYMVVVKVGKPTERSKPGNRGKRDSQILLMHYLNRVHFDLPMSPLELEIYHQMRNVIGIDPAFYEYIFTIDADTTVTPDSLNRLVASSADDSRIIGICGETKLMNPEDSWWTMIQVYEYYISHHLSKAFESLFGSVTCLPGCFSLYRIRTADKGRPIIISSRVIDEYAEPNVDTLHKKNLFSLGEDRFLTTLLMKHFPTFKTKFRGDAIAYTMAPESWRILFSQRRRWINSTIHNLCELVLLPELFGFCCFSMRFFVFIDLLSTLILPATVVYLLYLIITVATHVAPLPLIAIIMIAAVYGLQAIIFILKREFMLIGWMVVYILSYPVYSFFLPVYSFWCMDEFGWGNTRLVIGEGKDKKVVVSEDDKFDDSMIPLKKFSEYEAEAWEMGSKHSDDTSYQQPRSRGPGSGKGSPRSYNQASQSGDFYRDTNAMSNNASNPNLRSQASHSNLSHHGDPMQHQPQAQMPYQLPFMPFAGGPGSAAGSDYGGGMQMPQMPYQNTGSMYGMMPPMMPAMGMFNTPTGGSFGSQGGFAPPVMPGAQQNRMSTFSLATTVNLGGPSQNPNPSDEELFTALRNYLSTQDLMTVTKKTAREAIANKFPKADLSSRKDYLNQSIDQILSSQ